MNKSVKIVLLIVSLFGLGVFLMILTISKFFQDSRPKIEKESLNIEFSGVVESINYSVKGFPTALINNRYIYIHGFNNKQLEVGDSVVKNLGKNVVYQFRRQELIDSINDFVVIDSIVKSK